MSATDPALWLLVTSVTRSSAGRTSETLLMRDRLLDIAERYRHCGVEHRAGHSFEVLHAWSFNVDAIRNRLDVRAQWIGARNGSADIRIVDAAGRVLTDVQTKLMDVPSATAAKLGADRYVGMARVVASDKLDDVARYLAKGRHTLNPGRVNAAGYVDAEAHIVKRIDVGGVRSESMTRSEVHRIAADPGPWATARTLQAAGHQVGLAVATGAACGALIAGGLTAIGECVRACNGETTAVDAAWTVAVAAGTGAARSAVVAGLGEVVRIASRQKFAGSAVPLAVASAVVDVGAAGIALARDEVDTTELALRSGESVLGTVAAVLFAAAGNTVAPVVGGFVGGMVGPLAVAAVADWVRPWIARTDDSDEPVMEPAAIEAVPSAEGLAAQVDAVIGQMSEWLAGVRTYVVTTADEFEAWMSAPTSSPLVLDPNPA